MRAHLTLTLVMILSLALAACAGVLGLHRESTSRPFEHRAHALKGINCVECHKGISSAGEGGPLHFPADSDCVRCHTKPHDQRACSGCHGESYVRGGVALAKQRLRFDHAKHLRETRGDCIRCHADVTASAPEVIVPRMATCFGCHEHRDQWTMRDCDGCHVNLSGDGTLPADHLVHEGDWVHEHGTRAASERDLCSSCHTERQCASCHGVGTVPALPSKLAFDDVRLSGLHRAGFLARHADEARADPGLCSTCHGEQSCIDCHTRQNVGGTASGPRNPHPPGWLTTGAGGGEHGVQARIDPMSCASCHGGAGEQLCVGCHRVGGPGGNPHGPGFNSKKDMHHDVPCRQCHGVGP